MSSGKWRPFCLLYRNSMLFTCYHLFRGDDSQILITRFHTPPKWCQFTMCSWKYVKTKMFLYELHRNTAVWICLRGYQQKTFMISWLRQRDAYMYTAACRLKSPATRLFFDTILKLTTQKNQCFASFAFCTKYNSSISVRCDMAFTEPMHHNKPDITYLLTCLFTYPSQYVPWHLNDIAIKRKTLDISKIIYTYVYTCIWWNILQKIMNFPVITKPPMYRIEWKV